MNLPAAALLIAMLAPECLPDTYELDGGTYYKVPVVRLDGSVDQIDAEVDGLKLLFCREVQTNKGTTPIDSKYILACIGNRDGKAEWRNIPFTLDGGT